MKGDRFGMRMSGIAADLVLKTGGEISRMRIGAGDEKYCRESPKRCRAGIGPDFGDSSTARFVY